MEATKWAELETKLGDKMWEINKEFLAQQIKQDKKLYLSHNPRLENNTRNTYLGKELDYIKNHYDNIGMKVIYKEVTNVKDLWIINIVKK